MALAKKKGPPPPPATPEYRVVEVNAVSITITVGQSGDQHLSYKITDGTKVTLNGAPAFARDLRAGMMVRIDISPDRTTALAITAKDPPATHGRRKVG
jgi:hypothetical protein